MHSWQFPKTYVNLCPVACSAAFYAYQQAHRLQAKVYNAHSSNQLIPDNSSRIPDSKTGFPDLGLLLHAFSATVSPSDPISQENSDNKNNILMRSQMFWALDCDKFQDYSLSGRQDCKPVWADIVDSFNKSTLPPWVMLLSSIWSYWRNCLLNGTLSKYKSHLCANGKEQPFGWDFWEKYAPVDYQSILGKLNYFANTT
jgi:hypothetical protein